MVYTLRFFFSLKCSLFHISNLFGSCIIHILYTECAKIKKYFRRQKVKDGNTSIQAQPRSGRPRTASTEPNEKRVDEIIKENRRGTLGAIVTKLVIGHNAVQEMIGSLGYRKICASWVPRLLTKDRKV